MNRADIVQAMAQHSNLSQKASGEALDGALDALTLSLRKGEEVSIKGFGKFTVTDKKERPGRNPRTGETIPIAAHRAVKFTPHDSFKAEIQNRA